MRRIVKKIIKVIMVIFTAVIAPASIGLFVYGIGIDRGAAALTMSIIIGYTFWIGLVGLVAVGVPVLIETFRLVIKWINE